MSPWALKLKIQYHLQKMVIFRHKSNKTCVRLNVMEIHNAGERNQGRLKKWRGIPYSQIRRLNSKVSIFS